MYGSGVHLQILIPTIPRNTPHGKSGRKGKNNYQVYYFDREGLYIISQLDRFHCGQDIDSR